MELNKTGNVSKTSHWGMFVQPRCNWKAVSTTHSDSVCLQPQEYSMECVCAILSSLGCPALLYLSTLPRKWQHFRKKKKVTHIKWVFCFSLQLVSETFLILKITKGDMIKMHVGLHAKYRLFLSDFNGTW